jgi:hypothetical protein
VTGWNLPPGCSVRDIPGNGPEDETCLCCGRDAADCICPECPVCQHACQGDPACYAAGHLEYSPEQVAGRDAYRARLEAEAAAEAAYWEQLAAAEKEFWVDEIS